MSDWGNPSAGDKVVEKKTLDMWKLMLHDGYIEKVSLHGRETENPCPNSGVAVSAESDPGVGYQTATTRTAKVAGVLVL